MNSDQKTRRIITTFTFPLVISALVIYFMLTIIYTPNFQFLLKPITENNFLYNKSRRNSSIYIFILSSIISVNPDKFTILRNQTRILNTKTNQYMLTGLDHGYCWFVSSMQALLSLNNFKLIHLELIGKAQEYKTKGINDPFISGFLEFLSAYYQNTFEDDTSKIGPLYFEVIKHTNFVYLDNYLKEGGRPDDFISLLFLKLENYLSASTLDIFTSTAYGNPDSKNTLNLDKIGETKAGSAFYGTSNETASINLTIKISKSFLIGIKTTVDFADRLREIIKKNLMEEGVKKIGSVLFLELNFSEVFLNMDSKQRKSVEDNLEIPLLKNVKIDRKIGLGEENFIMRSFLVVVKGHGYTLVLGKNGEYKNTEHELIDNKEVYQNFSVKKFKDLIGFVLVYEVVEEKNLKFTELV